MWNQEKELKDLNEGGLILWIEACFFTKQISIATPLNHNSGEQQKQAVA